MGFLELGKHWRQGMVQQLVHTADPNFVVVSIASARAPACPVAGGASFGDGRSENFHRLFTSDITPLQGECAAIVQVLQDTPPDVPLRISCLHPELRCEVTA